MAESEDLRQFMRDIASQDRYWRENYEEHRARRQALFRILGKLQDGGAAA